MPVILPREHLPAASRRCIVPAFKYSLAGETNAEGRFRFENILPGKYLQLAYWGDGVPQGKSLAFDETKAGETKNVTIRLPEPAVIRGSFVRENFPDAGRVYLGSSGPSAEIPSTKVSRRLNLPIFRREVTRSE